MSGIIITSAVAIVVAVVGAAAGIWAQAVQFKRDSGKLDGVKTDTVEMKPNVSYIREDTTKLRDKLLPTVQIVGEIGSGVDQLVNELNYQKRMKSEVAGALTSSDYLIQGINTIYEENARLANALRQERQRNHELQLRINVLESQLPPDHSREEER